MGEFTGESAFAPFPNLYSDLEEVHSVADDKLWPQERLDYKTNEYGAFLQRKDPMPRAVAMANRILDYLLFEQACRDGVYSDEGEFRGAA